MEDEGGYASLAANDEVDVLYWATTTTKRRRSGVMERGANALAGCQNAASWTRHHQRGLNRWSMLCK